MIQIIKHRCNEIEEFVSVIKDSDKNYISGVEIDIVRLFDKLWIGHGDISALYKLLFPAPAIQSRAHQAFMTLTIDLERFIGGLPDGPAKENAERVQKKNDEFLKELPRMLVDSSKTLVIDVKKALLLKPSDDTYFIHLLEDTSTILPPKIHLCITGMLPYWRKVVENTVDLWHDRRITYFVHPGEIQSLKKEYTRDNVSFGLNKNIRQLRVNRDGFKTCDDEDARMIYTVDKEGDFNLARKLNPTYVTTNNPAAIREWKRWETFTIG